MLKYVENHFECSGVFKRILVGFLNSFGGVGGSCTQLEAVGKAEWLPWGSEVSLLLFHKCVGGQQNMNPSRPQLGSLSLLKTTRDTPGEETARQDTRRHDKIGMAGMGRDPDGPGARSSGSGPGPRGARAFGSWAPWALGPAPWAPDPGIRRKFLLADAGAQNAPPQGIAREGCFHLGS